MLCCTNMGKKLDFVAIDSLARDAPGRIPVKGTSAGDVCAAPSDLRHPEPSLGVVSWEGGGGNLSSALPARKQTWVWVKHRATPKNGLPW